MLRILYPSAYYKSIFDIPLDALKRDGIEGLIFDVDNTLSPYDCPEPDSKIIEFMGEAVHSGFAVCLLSNNTKGRVELYNKKLRVFAVHNALKPFGIGLGRAIKLIGATKSSVVLIGDQIFTDVLCGNIAGVRTILVEPCSTRDEWITRVKRGIERKVIDSYKKNRVIE